MRSGMHEHCTEYIAIDWSVFELLFTNDMVHSCIRDSRISSSKAKQTFSLRFNCTSYDTVQHYFRHHLTLFYRLIVTISLCYQCLTSLYMRRRSKWVKFGVFKYHFKRTTFRCTDATLNRLILQGIVYTGH